MKTHTLALALLVLSTPTFVAAQETEDRILLTQEEMTAVINEVSGERAMHHLMELVPYQRIRPAMEYVADISRERVRFRRSLNGYAPTQPVESPRGSKDAFYIKIDQHYGSSVHVTYMQHGIPAVMFITWPDMLYHSSEDTPDKQDPTQYKRAAAVGLGSLAVLATGTDEMAARVVSENLGRGLSRMGESHTKGLGYLADATSATDLTTAFREARVAILHQVDVCRGKRRIQSHRRHKGSVHVLRGPEDPVTAVRIEFSKQDHRNRNHPARQV